MEPIRRRLSEGGFSGLDSDASLDPPLLNPLPRRGEGTRPLGVFWVLQRSPPWEGVKNRGTFNASDSCQE